MARNERQVAIKYIGEGVRTIKGVGKFQHGTVAFLPAPEACKLANEDDFVFAGSSQPASRVSFRIGQIATPDSREQRQEPPPEVSPEMEPWLDNEPEAPNDEPE